MSSFSDLISHPHQSLDKHLATVNDVFARALAKKVIQPVFASTEQLQRWRTILVYFHDFGKSTRFFQHKIIKATNREKPELNEARRAYIEQFYSSLSAKTLERYIADYSHIDSHALLGAFAMHQYDMQTVAERCMLFAIIRRHHGNLKNFDVDEFTAPDENILQLQWEHADRERYQMLLSHRTDLERQLPETLNDILIAYSGLELELQLDRILPTTNCVPYFRVVFLFSLLLAADKGDLMMSQRELVGKVNRFDQQLIATYKQQQFGSIGSKPIDTEREFAYRLVQENVLTHWEAPFYSITLPTGLGKTFTAYNAAIRLQNVIADRHTQQGASVVPRIIYCLPFTSIIDQNSTILEQILELNGQKQGYMCRHHYLSDLPSRRDTAEELEYSEKEYLAEGWEYPITVTTFVQLLETIFSNRNRQLRKFHNISNAIVILDEVQNIPPKYFEVVETAFQTLYDCFNTRFIFVTATQPILIKNHPVIELSQGKNPEESTEHFFTRRDRIELDLSLLELEKPTLDELIIVFQQHIESEPKRSFLIILNKVLESQKVFQHIKAMPGDRELLYLSAAVLPALRKERIEKIKQHSGNKQLVVVSTQVVEAGVDIDLDIVYRAFAPLDSINQSAGRCNRNGLKGKGLVRVFPTPPGGRQVYPPELLNITERVLHRARKRTGSDRIPERAFYRINQDYATHIRAEVADHNDASEIIAMMKRLQFENVSKTFKLIEQDEERYSVFVEANQEASAVWNEYLATDTIEDRWERKRATKGLRPRLMQYIVQFPHYISPPEFKGIAEEKGIVFLGNDEFERCYSLEIGYLPLAPPPIMKAFQT